MTRQELAELYESRAAARSEEQGRRRDRVAVVSYARLAVFAAGVAVLWFVWETDRVSWPWLLLPLFVFIALMVWHARLHDAMTRARRAERFYRKGLARLRGEWAGAGTAGKAYADPGHPYVNDLDIFGEGSLFELLATTESPWGTSMLAGWLREAASSETVRGRQAAVAELAPMIDLREAIASEHAEVAMDDVDSETLSRWAVEPPVLTSRAAQAAALVLGIVTLTSGIGWLASWWDRLPFLLLMAISGSFALAFRTRVSSVLSAVESPASDLGVLSTLLERLETVSFDAPRLKALQQTLQSDGEAASSRIAHLGRLVDRLDARRNQLFAPFAALLLWGTQFAFAIESWRKQYGPAVPNWLGAVGELDALLALATYAAEHPEDPYPTVRDDGAVFAAEGLGHPLIPAEKLVRNDITFGDQKRLLVVSGSNMSGKSTFLRAVGVNTVLAFAGAPVRAAKLELSPFQVAASIRIVDSLQDGISHFYAEILRLRQVMELASGDRTLLFLLDEILHGTNSHDRRIGAEAVVRGLVDKGAVGLITTHDLALSKLADELNEKAANVHFEDQIVDGKIEFDYVMREGVVKKSNALDLMRSIGLEV